MMSQEEMREIMDAGLHNDTWFDKQVAHRSRKEGFKVWGIDRDTAKPYVEERGFATEEDAKKYIRQHRKRGKWFVKVVEETDPDYYESGEKGFWSSMSDEEYEYYSDYMDS